MVLMLAPVIPHLCHQLWQDLGQEGLVIDCPWPQYDESALVQETIEMVIQVNGKLRGRMQIGVDTDKTGCQDLALQNQQVQRHIDGQPVKKIIVVPNKLVNIVV
jgi:leucyl-tRNA synthetase